MSKDVPEYFAVEAELRDIAIVASRYNSGLVDALLESVIQTLIASGAKEENIEIFRVPGANETPYAVSMLASSGDFDVIIALGVVIGGQTEHHTIIAESTGFALQSVATDLQVPVINGIITVSSLEQAEARVTGDYKRGVDYARAALEMAQLHDVLEDRLLENAMDFSDEDLDSFLEWDGEDDPEDLDK